MTAQRAGLTRPKAIVAVFVIIACGLAWRRPELGLPWALAKYGGSALWGAMVFFCIAAVLNPVRLLKIVLLAAIVSASVEASQAFSYAPLDAFRRTPMGALLLGRTFDWWDILAYWAGIAVAALFCVAALRGDAPEFD